MATIDELIDAAKAGDADRVTDLVKSDPGLLNSRNASGESAVIAALYRGHRAVVDRLIAAGAELDVFAAAATGRMEPLTNALRSPESVNSYSYDGWTPLHLAAFFGQLEAARLLLDRRASVSPVSKNSLRNTPLHAASAGGHVPIALLLIDKGADVRAGDAGGHTPLHIAAENGLTAVVKALIERGADPLAVDAEDKTPLARAAAKNRNEVIDLLNSVRR
jgi:uncharacterized protein